MIPILNKSSPKIITPILYHNAIKLLMTKITRLWLVFSITTVSTVQQLTDVKINRSIIHEFIYHNKMTKMPMQSLIYAWNVTYHINANNISIIKQNLNNARNIRHNARNEILGCYNSPFLTGISSSKFTRRALDISHLYPTQALT